VKIVLFIGHHKVGSTSLQDFLARNSVALARAGILYPCVDFQGMSLMLVSAIRGQAPDDVLSMNAREPHNALAFKLLAEHNGGKVPSFHKGLPSSEQMFWAINKQIEFLTPDTVILAAEVFANFAPTSSDLIVRLRDAFPEADITVVATLRRIDEYLASWHGQRLKFGHKMAPLRKTGAQKYFGNIHFDYQLMLEGWIKAMPAARFILRNYSDVRQAGGSVTDFFVQTGLKLPRGMKNQRHANDSLHRGVYEIARRGNRVLSPPLAGKLRQRLQDLTPDLGLPVSGDIELFGTRNRRAMQERFEPIHSFLSQVSGKVSFFKDQPQVETLRPIAERKVFRQAVAGVAKHLKYIPELEIKEFLTTLDTH